MKLLLLTLRGIGLGLAVGAILHSEVSAQIPPVRTDTTAAQRDSLRARQIADSIAAAADTLRPPTPGYPAPPVLDEDMLWRGDEILSSGALTLAELIARVPGTTVFRAGSSVTPSVTAYGGCFNCIRIYLDGAELAALDPRSGGILDNAEIPLWTLEEVKVVRGAGEIRVYLKTWGVEKTIPYTRLDIFTGSDETTVFGLSFGKRGKGGEILQVGVQKFATTSRLETGSGDRSDLFLRLGVTKERFSLDGTVTRSSRFREDQASTAGVSPLPAFEGSRTDAMLRATFGRPAAGPWLQLVAASENVEEKTPGTGPPPPAPGDPPGPGADTSRTQAQYLISAGSRIGPINATGSARFRSEAGFRTNEFSVLAQMTLAAQRFDFLVRRDTRDSLMRGEVSVLSQPLSFVRLSGSVGQQIGIGSAARPDGLFANGDVGLRIRRLWFHGGVVMRDSLTLPAPIIFDAALSPRDEPAATGTYGRIRGAIWRDIHTDVTLMRWDTDGWYRPRNEATGSIYVDSSWPRKFPNNTFHVHAGLTLRSRSEVRFPAGPTSEFVADGHSTLSSKIEIRILSAVISWQNRNIRGLEQSEVPGLLMPRRLNTYGVRWVLWN